MRSFMKSLLLAGLFYSLASFAGGGSDIGNGGNDIAFEFYKSAKTAIQSALNSNEFPEIKDANLLKILDSAKINVTTQPLTLGTDHLELVAVNSKVPNNSITINSRKWRQIDSETRRQALAFHEILGLADLEYTGYYNLSQRFYLMNTPALNNLKNNQLARLTLNQIPVALYPYKPRVTAVIFTDYESSANHALVSTLKTLIEEYTNKGVEFIVRNFPISSIHPNSQEAAIAGICAARQNQFQSMHWLLLENGDRLNSKIYKTLAKKILRLELKSFLQCLNSPTAHLQLQADLTMARDLNLGASPIVIFTSDINSTKSLVGAYQIEDYRAALDKMLDGDNHE